MLVFRKLRPAQAAPYAMDGAALAAVIGEISHSPLDPVAATRLQSDRANVTRVSRGQSPGKTTRSMEQSKKQHADR